MPRCMVFDTRGCLHYERFRVIIISLMVCCAVSTRRVAAWHVSSANCW